jgi:hypothetical protein
VGQYSYSPIRLHGVVLGELSIGTTSRLFTYGGILCCFEKLSSGSNFLLATDSLYFVFAVTWLLLSLVLLY